MNTIDSIPRTITAIQALVGCIVFFSVAAHADAPPAETFNKPADLILTLSDDWQPPENTRSPLRGFKNQSRAGNKFVTNKEKKDPIGVDCGMDVNPYPSADNSLTSRITGECNLKYNY